MSYAPLFVDRITAVVGDSDLALRAAAELAQIARRVTLVAPTHGLPITDLEATMPQVRAGLLGDGAC